MRPTRKLLDDLESLVSALGYHLRYEKGNFKGGACVVEQRRLVVINKFFALEGKVATLTEVIPQLAAPQQPLEPALQQLWLQLCHSRPMLALQ